MRKFILSITVGIISCWMFADSGFTVTHCNLKRRITSFADGASALSDSARWSETPIIRSYNTLAFLHYLRNDREPHFESRMVAFPGIAASSQDYYAYCVVEARGKIFIPEAGSWTFACGCDDQVRISISGYEMSENFIAGDGAFRTDLKEFIFPVPGVYEFRLVYINYCDEAAFEVSVAKGSYTTFNNSAFHLLGDPVSAVICKDGDTYVVAYDINDGTGTMAAQAFEDGKKQKLSKNTFRKDGYVFQGWAETADGPAVYTDEQEITVDHDMTLYAVWANPALTLTAESADWSIGSITLRCEDADQSGAEHTYWLMYYEEMEPEKKWYQIGVGVKATKEVDSNWNSILVAHLTDGQFAKRMDGLRTVKYQVWDENGRLSNTCTTRNRRGLFVGINKYRNGSDLKGCIVDAHNISKAFANYGDCNNNHFLLDSMATKHNIIEALTFLSGHVNSGDILLFFFSGHGSEGGYLACHDSDSRAETKIASIELARLFVKFPRGLGLVCMLDACYSTGMIPNGNYGQGFRDDVSQCMNNLCSASSFAQLSGDEVAWITSSQDNETSFDSNNGGLFTTECIYDKGWIKGRADGIGLESTDGYVTFGELAEWGQEWTAKNHDRYKRLSSFKNSLVLDHIVAGRVPPHAPWTLLTLGPSSLTARPGKAGEINLKWPVVVGATGYDVYCRKTKPTVSQYAYEGSVAATKYVVGRDSALDPNTEYEYYVRAINDVDVSPASPTATCTPNENTNLRDYIVSFAQSFSLLPQSFAPPVENGAVNYSNLNYDHDGDGLTTFEEYVAGSDPVNVESTFVSKISIDEDGVPRIEWSPDTPELRTTRIYRTLGKKSLMDADWVDVTDMDQSEYRFFKVTVELADGDGDSGDDGGDGGDSGNNGNDNTINLDDFEIEQGVLQWYDGDATDVVIPSCVTNIGEYAFAGNTNLVSMTIPVSVTNIGDYAFAHCSDLTSMTFAGNAPGVGSNVFQGDSACTVYVSQGSSGWGVAIPGTWNGLPIRFKDGDESP